MINKKALKRSLRHITTATLIVGISACGASDSDETASTSGSGTEIDPDELIASNPLAAAYPSGLALSVFPQSTSSVALVQDTSSDDEKKLPEEKVQDRRKILQGGADSECFSANALDDRSAETVTCYEFDNDMNPYTTPDGTGGTTNGKHTDGEACLVAFARQEVLDATQYIDRALDTVAGMLCAVKKAGGDTELPAENEEKDYAAEMESAATGITFTTAKMKNLGDGIYRSHIALGDGSNEFEMTLVYKAGDTEGESSGVISYKSSMGGGGDKGKKLQGEPGPGGEDPNNTENMKQYVSVTFEQAYDDAGALRNKSEVRIAAIEKSLDGFNDQGVVDYDVIPENSANETSNVFKYVQFDIDAETAEGDISYWRNPGGRYDESARGFVFNISADEDTGTLSGCGASGAANVSIRATMSSSGEGSSLLAPVRYWHPFANNNTHADKDDRYTGGGQGPYITTQCFAQDASTGVYEIDYATTKGISDSTVEEEIDAHGYDVIPQADGNSRIKPPGPPARIPEGDFKPPSEG